MRHIPIKMALFIFLAIAGMSPSFAGGPEAADCRNSSLITSFQLTKSRPDSPIKIAVFEVNGNKARLALDSGANSLMVSSDFAMRAELDIRESSDLKRIDRNGDIVNVPVAASLSVTSPDGAFRARYDWAAVIDSSVFETFKFDGLIPPQFLTDQYTVRIPLSENRLFVEEHQDCSKGELLQEAAIPMRFPDGFPIVTGTAPSGRSGPFIIDTGAGRTNFFAGSLKAETKLDESNCLLTEHVSGKRVCYPLLEKTSFQIGHLALSSERPIYKEKADLPDHLGLLGLDILTNFTLIFTPKNAFLIPLQDKQLRRDE